MTITEYETEVEPTYRHDTVLTSSHRTSSSKVKVYPVKVGGHNVQLKYIYEKQQGKQNLVQLGYYCTQCEKECFANHDRLSEADDENVAQLRGWMYGYFYANDCQ